MSDKKRSMNLKAVSPLVSTVLLIMIVIVIALIIVTWSGVFFREAITKEIAGEKKSAEKYCSEISIQTFINPDGSFGFTNTGNVPISSYNVKLSGSGSSEVITISSPQGAVNPGYSTLAENPPGAPIDYSLYEKVSIIPVILGKSEGGSAQQFTCPESNSFEV